MVCFCFRRRPLGRPNGASPRENEAPPIIFGRHGGFEGEGQIPNQLGAGSGGGVACVWAGHPFYLETLELSAGGTRVACIGQATLFLPGNRAANEFGRHTCAVRVGSPWPYSQRINSGVSARFAACCWPGPTSPCRSARGCFVGHRPYSPSPRPHP